MTGAGASSAASRGGARRAARIAAVQALYQIAFTDRTVEAVLDEFGRWRLDARDAAGDRLPSADRELFGGLVRGVAARRDELDALIRPRLSAGWSPERLDPVVRAILRAAAWELLGQPETPARVVIDEYVSVARAFFNDREPGFVNSVVDGLARDLRAAEMAGEAPDAGETV